MSFYDNRYYHLNKTFLSILGQWPFQSQLKSKVAVGIALLWICSLTGLELFGLITGISNLSIVMEYISPLLITCLILVKLINSIFNKYKMKHLLESIEQTWKMTQIGPESEILRSYAEQSRILTIQYALIILETVCIITIMILQTICLCYINYISLSKGHYFICLAPQDTINYSEIMVFLTIFFFSVEIRYYSLFTLTFSNFVIYFMGFLYSMMPIIVNGIYFILPMNENYTTKFIYRLDHVLDVDKYFNFLMLHTFISVFFLISVPVAIDSMFILCIQHVCALFKGIKYKIGCIRGSDFVILKPNLKNDEAYHIIIDCIKSYKRALQFSALLSSTYATSFFFLLGTVIISLSFNAAQLIIVDNKLDEIIRIIAGNLGQLVHIFYLSFTSQRLIDHSSELQDVIYNSEWYKISLRSRQLLTFTLMRAMKPCQIKVGNIYVMSMVNFSSILQVSMSYFTMLTSVQ